MNMIRRWAAVVFALALAAFATPGLAQQLKTFALTGFDAFDTAAEWSQTTTIPKEISVINNSPTTKSNYNSFRIFAPVGFKIVAATSTNNGSRGGNVTPNLPQIWTTADANQGKSYVEVRGISPSVGNSSGSNFFNLTITVKRSCSAASGPWLVQVKSGGDLGGADFDHRDPTTGEFLPFPTATTDGGGPGCEPKVEFVPGREPKSAVLDKDSGLAAITSVANNAAGAPVRVQVMVGPDVNTAYTGEVSINIKSGPTSSFSGGTVKLNATAGIAEFTPPPLVNAKGYYSLEPKTPTLTGAAQTILVSDALLNCAYYADTDNNPATPPVLVVPADAKVDVGDYWDVVRHQFKGTTCVLTNYVTTSGGTDTSPVTDPSGFSLGTDFFSIVYDVPPDGVLLTHSYISSPYPMDANGQAPQKKVTYCKEGTFDATNNPNPKDCTKAANRVNAKGCLSDAIAGAAIPGYAPGPPQTGDPGCVRSLGWFAVSPSVCTAVGIAAPNGCVRFLVELLEAKDPPWGLTD